MLPKHPQPFADGEYFHSRGCNGGYQVYMQGLLHVCQCDSPNIAALISEALDAANGMRDRIHEEFKKMEAEHGKA